MIRNEEFLQLREAYIEIGKMVQKYGYGQYNGILRILMDKLIVLTRMRAMVKK